MTKKKSVLNALSGAARYTSAAGGDLANTAGGLFGSALKEGQGYLARGRDGLPSATVVSDFLQDKSRTLGLVQRKQVPLLDELERIAVQTSAAIQQTSEAYSRSIAKSAVGYSSAAVVTGGVSGLVSTLGTASTGTAIATLSGAAAKTATLYWLGSAIGLGVAAGGVILATGGLAAGYGANRLGQKYYWGKARRDADFEPFERHILAVCAELIEAVRQQTELDRSLQQDELATLASSVLDPLVRKIEHHWTRDDMSLHGYSGERSFEETLTAYRRRKLKRAVVKVKRMGRAIRNGDVVDDVIHFDVVPMADALSSTIVIGVVFGRLIAGEQHEWEPEEQLVFDALRRSNGALTDASLDELATYLQGLEPEQLRGVASNVKGIYHEILFTEAENTDGDDVEARLFEASNHPGADVEFVVDGDVIAAVQLKAVQTAESVERHLERYPDVPILVTEEVAAGLPDVEGSGFYNDALAEDVGGAFGTLSDSDEGVVDGIATAAPGLASLTFATSALRHGKMSKDQLKGITAGTITAQVLNALLG